ncbi:MAG: type VII toxin-antitoxin system HepT family RNase toxin [Thermodesulfovibrionales bacterium]
MRIDIERINERIKDIEKAIGRIEAFKSKGKEEFLSIEDNIHIFRSHFLIAVEAAVSICYHLSAKLLKTTPAEYSGCFELLHNKEMISKELKDGLVKLSGIRNRMVHRYEKVDYGFLYENIDSILQILERFIKELAEILRRHNSVSNRG